MRSTGELIDEALRAPFRGWDFSWLRGRMDESRPPWDFGQIVREAMGDARRMLDLDTGGGEFLSGLAPFTGSVVATEGYAPNVAIARERLEPLGVWMVPAASAPDNLDQEETSPTGTQSALPVRDSAFDLVIDRHSSYWPSEVRRVLRDGGRFLTQQRSDSGVSGAQWEELFDRPLDAGPRFDVAFATGQLQEAGFEVERAEDADTPIAFRDLAAVVYYLRAVPWAVEGFDPVRDRDALERVHERIAREGELLVRSSHMLIVATSS